MQIANLPARAGRRWVLEGFKLLRRYPIQLLALTFLYLLILMFSTLLPMVGAFAPMVLTPLFAIGMLRAVQSADRGELPTPLMLFAGFRDDGGKAIRPLLMLGLVNLASTLGALAFASLADGGLLLQIATGSAPAEEPAVQQGSLMTAAVMFLAVYAPTQAALWYAPMFTAWHRIAVPKALFFSLVAVWRNKAAFIAYLLTWFLVALVFTLAIPFLRSLLAATPVLMSLLLSPLSLVLLATLYCSFWPSYRDAIQPD